MKYFFWVSCSDSKYEELITLICLQLTSVREIKFMNTSEYCKCHTSISILDVLTNSVFELKDIDIYTHVYKSNRDDPMVAYTDKQV